MNQGQSNPADAGPSAAAERPERKEFPWIWALLFLILLLAFVIRTAHLGRESLWGDEIAEACVRDKSWRQAFMFQLKNSVFSVPGDYFVTKLVVSFTDSEFWLRLPAVLWGMGSIWLLFAVASREGFPREGLVAALFLALCPFHIRYSRQVRYYSPLVFFTIAVTMTYLTTMRKDTVRGWALFALAGIVGLYFHFYVGFTLAAIFLWEAGSTLQSWRKDRVLPKRLKAFLLSNAIIGLAFGPYLIAQLAVGAAIPGGSEPRPLKPLRDLATMISHLAGTHYADGARVNWHFVFASSLALIGLVRIAMKRPRLLVLGIGILGMVLTYPKTRYYFFVPRFGIYLLPIFALTVGFGVAGIAEGIAGAVARTGGRVWLSRLLTAALAGAAVLYPARQTERLLRLGDPNQWLDWKALGRFVDLNCVEEPVYLVGYESARRGWWLDYYVHDRKLKYLSTGPKRIDPAGAVWALSLVSKDSAENILDLKGYVLVKMKFALPITIYYAEKTGTFDLERFAQRLRLVRSPDLVSTVMRFYIRLEQPEKGFSIAREWLDRIAPNPRCVLLGALGKSLRDYAFQIAPPKREEKLREAARYMEAWARIQPRVIYPYAYLTSIHNSLGEWSKTVELAPRIRRTRGGPCYWAAVGLAQAQDRLGDSGAAAATLRWAAERESDPKRRGELEKRAEAYEIKVSK